MIKFIQIFLAGLFISFAGSLPLGTLNVAAMQIGIQETILQAMYFSLGSLLVEMIYVRISLVGIEWVRKQGMLLRIMEWLTFIIIAALAIGSFWAAHANDGSTKNIMLDNHMNRFLLGMMMSAINPVQIPFWFGWSNILFTRNILTASTTHYNIYIVGIGLGTLAGNAVFIFGGKWLFSQMVGGQLYLNWIIGGIFAGTALLQLFKILRRKTAEQQLAEKK